MFKRITLMSAALAAVLAVAACSGADPTATPVPPTANGHPNARANRDADSADGYAGPANGHPNARADGHGGPADGYTGAADGHASPAGGHTAARTGGYAGARADGSRAVRVAARGLRAAMPDGRRDPVHQPVEFVRG